MAVNYEDERFQKVEADKQQALSQIEQTYSGLMDQSDAFYQNQVEATKQWEEQQKQLQQEQTDFALDQIEQQKQQAEKDYVREQSGAYVDWQKQSNQYGAEAEKMAAAGLAGSGFAESSQVAMYNAYQSRVATARENVQLIIQNYNNAMTEARLQNNAALAQIAYDSLQKQLELELQAFLHKSELELQLQTQKTQAEDRYHQQWQDVLAQINQENALAEQIRQFNASQAQSQAQFDASLAEEQRQFDALNGGNTGGAVISGNAVVDKKAEMEDQKAQSTIKGTGSSKPPVTPFVGSTYQAATTYLNKYGVLGNVATDLMTESKWNYLKQNKSSDPNVKNYSSYQAYLKAFCKYAVSTWG